MNCMNNEWMHARLSCAVCLTMGLEFQNIMVKNTCK